MSAAGAVAPSIQSAKCRVSEPTRSQPGGTRSSGRWLSSSPDAAPDDHFPKPPLAPRPGPPPLRGPLLAMRRKQVPRGSRLADPLSSRPCIVRTVLTAAQVLPKGSSTDCAACIPRKCGESYRPRVS